MVVADAIGIVAMLYLITAILDSAMIGHFSQAGLCQNIESRTPFTYSRRTQDRCAIARGLAGRWRVVGRHVGYTGSDISAGWIELRP